MNQYEVKIDAGVLEANLIGYGHNLTMNRTPRSASFTVKPVVYLLTDDRGHCCYVGETDNLQRRMYDHANKDRYCWWTHVIYFWHKGTPGVFDSTDDRRWYEKQLKELLEQTHPTFTKNVAKKPRQPTSGAIVLAEIRALLDVIGFDVPTGFATPPTSPTPPIKPKGRGTTKPGRAPASSSGRYAGWNNRQLIDELRRRGLPRSGGPGRGNAWFTNDMAVKALEADDVKHGTT